jgi:hypothetical protein
MSPFQGLSDSGSGSMGCTHRYWISPFQCCVSDPGNSTIERVETKVLNGLFHKKVTSLYFTKKATT